MNDIYVTLVGNVAAEPRQHTLSDGSRVTSLRVVTTTRHYDRGTQEWRDGDSTYFAVRCWRALGDNVAQSVRLGHPVVVQGRLRVRQFEHEGERRFIAEVEATSVGHDLRWGIGSFSRPQRGGAAPATLDPEARTHLDEATRDWSFPTTPGTTSVSHTRPPLPAQDTVSPPALPAEGAVSPPALPATPPAAALAAVPPAEDPGRAQGSGPASPAAVSPSIALTAVPPAEDPGCAQGSGPASPTNAHPVSSGVPVARTPGPRLVPVPSPQAPPESRGDKSAGTAAELPAPPRWRRRPARTDTTPAPAQPEGEQPAA